MSFDKKSIEYENDMIENLQEQRNQITTRFHEEILELEKRHAQAREKNLELLRSAIRHKSETVRGMMEQDASWETDAEKMHIVMQTFEDEWYGLHNHKKSDKGVYEYFMQRFNIPNDRKYLIEVDNFRVEENDNLVYYPYISLDINVEDCTVEQKRKQALLLDPFFNNMQDNYIAVLSDGEAHASFSIDNNTVYYEVIVLGDGYYKITNILDTLTLDQIDVSDREPVRLEDLLMDLSQSVLLLPQFDNRVMVLYNDTYNITKRTCIRS